MVDSTEEKEDQEEVMSEITDKELNEMMNDENINLIESQIDP